MNILAFYVKAATQQWLRTKECHRNSGALTANRERTTAFPKSHRTSTERDLKTVWEMDEKQETGIRNEN